MGKLINYRAEDGLGAFIDETPVRYRFGYSVSSFFAIAPIVPFPPVVGSSLLLLDVSKWNGRVNFAQARDNGARGFWIKSDQGTWVDSFFEQHVTDALDDGVDFGFYHFIDPNQTALSPEDAARHCASLTRDVGTLSTWVDAERSGPLGPQGMLDYLIRWVDTYKSILPDKVVEVYTRLSWFNSSVARSGYWRNNGIRLNAARYNLALSSPWSDNRYYPLDWDLRGSDFEGWQYSADGNGMGAYFGAESSSIDLDLFSGTESDFVAVYKLEPETPPVEPPDLVKRVEALEIKVNELSIKHDSDIAALDQRVSALERSDPIDPDLPNTIRVEITEAHRPHYYRSTDDKGKPIMEVRTDLDAFVVGQIWDCARSLILHARDDDGPTTIASGGGQFYRIVTDGPYKGRFIRADKAREVSL